MKATIGQKVLAAVLSEQLGISVERAMKLYVIKKRIHPSWEKIGDALLRNTRQSNSGWEVKMPELLS